MAGVREVVILDLHGEAAHTRIERRALGDRPRHEHAAELEAWVSQVLREWGSCGRVVMDDDTAAAVVLYAPPAYLPGAADLPTAPVSPDAVLLAQLHVRPEARRGGLGRMLVQGMARDLVKRGGLSAVEAFGDTRGPGRANGCLVPADFLGSVGFKTHRPHGTTPRMRMELRTALTWRTEVEAALERLSRMLTGLEWRELAGFLPPEFREPGLGRRSAVASSLIAGLELARTGEAELRQAVPFGPIMLRRRLPA